MTVDGFQVRTNVGDRAPGRQEIVTRAGFRTLGRRFGRDGPWQLAQDPDSRHLVMRTRGVAAMTPLVKAGRQREESFGLSHTPLVPATHLDRGPPAKKAGPTLNSASSRV